MINKTHTLLALFLIPQMLLASLQDSLAEIKKELTTNEIYVNSAPQQMQIYSDANAQYAGLLADILGADIKRLGEIKSAKLTGSIYASSAPQEQANNNEAFAAYLESLAKALDPNNEDISTTASTLSK